MYPLSNVSLHLTALNVCYIYQSMQAHRSFIIHFGCLDTENRTKRLDIHDDAIFYGTSQPLSADILLYEDVEVVDGYIQYNRSQDGTGLREGASPEERALSLRGHDDGDDGLDVGQEQKCGHPAENLHGTATPLMPEPVPCFFCILGIEMFKF